jgi:hypothetical protein
MQQWLAAWCWQRAGLLASPAHAKPSVSFNGIKDGAKAESPVHLEFVAEGVEVRPAAEGLQAGTPCFLCSAAKDCSSSSCTT